MNIDWNRIEKQLSFEDSLIKATTECIAEFSKLNLADETYCAFAYDIELQQGHFGLCLNTLEYFKEQENSESYSDLEVLNEELKYNPGNWKYQTFNNSDFDSIRDIWDLNVGAKLNTIYEILEGIEFSKTWDEDTIDEIYSGLIGKITKSIESVVTKLRKGNSFSSLTTTKDFLIFWIDFEEDVAEVVKRTNK